MLATFLILATMAAIADGEADRPRLFVLTDISSLTAGVAEPDDGQSLIRLLLYSNEFDIEGLVASSNLGHGRRVRPDLIAKAIHAYEAVRPSLARHDPRYPSADRLRAAVHAGRPEAGPSVPVAACVGEGKATDGSRAILDAADRPDPRPLWVLIWGGSADLAQALDDARRERSPEELRRLLRRLRVHSIGDQDSTGPWIKEQFPDLYVITQQRAYRGMYRGGDPALASSAWVQAHAKGHGPLGDLYPDYNGGDIFGRTLGPVRGIKEGDTPSFLSLVPNGLSDPERPWLGSWGGRFQVVANRGVDIPDPGTAHPDDPDPRMSTVYRWRPAYQADFEARLDWCVRTPGEANHPPEPRVGGGADRRARPGDTLTLDANGSTDPDGDALTYAWEVYPRDVAPGVSLTGDRSATVVVSIPADAPAGVVPVLLSVSDAGKPALTRYARVRIDVEPTP